MDVIFEAETRLHSATLNPQRTRIVRVPDMDWPASLLGGLSLAGTTCRQPALLFPNPYFSWPSIMVLYTILSGTQNCDTSCLCVLQVLLPLFSTLLQQSLIPSPLQNRNIGLPGPRYFPQSLFMSHLQIHDNFSCPVFTSKGVHFVQ